MMIDFKQISGIRDEKNLTSQFADFADEIQGSLAGLEEALDKMPLSNDVPRLEVHMSFVESWRHRVTKRLALAICFMEHAKSNHFMLAKTNKITADDRAAYQKGLIAPMIAIVRYLEETINDIDSRVNEVKKLLGPEYSIGGRRLNN